MKYRYILFDLDGTLLPMDQERFMKAYFGGLCKKLAPHGYEDPKRLVDAIWSGTKSMVMNDGEVSNEQAFWKRFAQIYGEGVYKDLPVFDDFYQNEFDGVQASCGYNPQSKRLVEDLRAAGVTVVLATNPLFPAIATEKRTRWAGLEPADFLLYTTYENSCHCKPNPDYYRDILNEIGADPADCLMVGNDVGEDMIAATLGMDVFLLTDCLINKAGEDISRYPNGSFAQLRAFLGLEA